MEDLLRKHTSDLN